MKNWIIVLLIFVIPLGLYGYLNAVANENPEVKAQNLSILEPQGMKETKIQEMPTFYKFSSPMCSDCKKMEKEMGPLKSKWVGKIIFKDVNVAGAEGDSKEVKDMISIYKITVVPAVVIVDKYGKLIKKTEGYQSGSQLDAGIKSAVGEK